MARSKAASKRAPHQPGRRPISTISAAVSLAALSGAGCAGNQANQHQLPISENLAPAVASPATEAIPMPDRDSTGYYSSWADAKNMGVTAPLNKSSTPAYDGPFDPTEPREIRRTFVPKVTRVSVPAPAVPATVVPTRPATVTETPIAATGLSDGQIVRIAETMQNAELAEASIVSERAQDARVKEFAAQLHSDNKRFKSTTAELAKSKSLTPAESPLSADMRIKASQELTSVELAPPEDFDKAFIDAQVQENEQMLQLLDGRLIPDASEPKLKAELTKSRAVLQRQGQEAKQIQRALQNEPAPSSAP